MSNFDINVDRRRTDGQKIGRLYRTLLQVGAIKRRGRKRVRSSDAFFYHSQLNRRLIFWTHLLHLVFSSLSAFTLVTQTDLLSDYCY